MLDDEVHVAVFQVDALGYGALDAEFESCEGSAFIESHFDFRGESKALLALGERRSVKFHKFDDFVVESGVGAGDTQDTVVEPVRTVFFVFLAGLDLV